MSVSNINIGQELTKKLSNVDIDTLYTKPTLVLHELTYIKCKLKYIVYYHLKSKVR